MYYDDIFLQNGFIDMLCKTSNQFVERLDVLSFDDVRPLIKGLSAGQSEGHATTSKTVDYPDNLG